MNKRLVAALVFAVSLGGAMMTWQDFRDGRSRFWLSGGVNLFEARREASPRAFWLFTAVNVALVALLLLVSVLLFVRPGAE